MNMKFIILLIVVVVVSAETFIDGQQQETGEVAESSDRFTLVTKMIVLVKS